MYISITQQAGGCLYQQQLLASVKDTQTGLVDRQRLDNWVKGEVTPKEISGAEVKESIGTQGTIYKLSTKNYTDYIFLENKKMMIRIIIIFKM